MARLKCRVCCHQCEHGVVGFLHLPAVAMTGEHQQVDLLGFDAQGRFKTGHSLGPPQAEMHVAFELLQQSVSCCRRFRRQWLTTEALLQLGGNQLKLPVEITLGAPKAGQQRMAAIQQSLFQGLQCAFGLGVDGLLTPGIEAGTELINDHRPSPATSLLR